MMTSDFPAKFLNKLYQDVPDKGSRDGTKRTVADPVRNFNIADSCDYSTYHIPVKTIKFTFLCKINTSDKFRDTPIIILSLLTLNCSTLVPFLYG